MMVEMKASPRPRSRIPRRRQPQNPRFITWARDDLPEIKPIVLPERKVASPTGCPIRLSSGSGDVGTFFTSLPYDIRREIYNLILQDVGCRQHIYSVPVKGPHSWKHLGDHYLIHQKCDDEKFEKTHSCGHKKCEGTGEGSLGARPGEGKFRIADLSSFMKTCKFGYFEISELLYQSITFVFAGFPELRTFADVFQPQDLGRIQSIAVIAHFLPRDAQACQQFLAGRYLQTDKEDNLALIRRMPNLKRLEINFFPSVILATSTRLPEALEPLKQLDTVSNIVVRVPGTTLRLATNTARPDTCRFFLPHMPKAMGKMTLRRPPVLVDEGEKYCKAYSAPWQLENV